jgi:hypothetical protein
MGNSENTAINDLIASVVGGPAEPSTVGSAPIAAQGSGHHPHVPRLGALQERGQHTTIPGTTPIAAPFEPPRAEQPTHPGVAPFEPPRAELPTSYPVLPRAMLGAVTPLAPDPVVPAPVGEPGEPELPS